MFEFFSSDTFVQFFSEYAYRPYVVYFFITCFMTASSFGLPIPEEIILLAAGLVGHMALTPAEYPPPFPGAEGVNVYVLTLVCFFSVWGSDLLIYIIGRFAGEKIFKTKFFQRVVSKKQLDRINKWFHDYSSLACGVFRFTPGIRFPGHLTCGMLKIPVWKFALIDGTAALISVPTQVLAISLYGDSILGKIKEFKLVFFAVLAAVCIIYVVKKIKKNKIIEQ